MCRCADVQMDSPGITRLLRTNHDDLDQIIMHLIT
jgi:hypothetical protein